jgi:hypothetical protein
MPTDAQPRFKKPAAQDAFYPPESQSAKRQLERGDILKNLPRCKSCNYPLNSKGECIKLECLQSVICPICYGPKEPGDLYCEAV